MKILRFLLAAVGSTLGLVLTIPLVLVAAPFWLVAALSALFLRAITAVRAPAKSWREMVVFDPEIGWRPKGDLDLLVRAENTIRVTTDSEGWRGRTPLDDARIVVIGDSYAFGHGTDDDEFFADRVPGVAVKALGGDGYNLVQEFLWLRRLGSRLEGKLVLWLVFYGNDLFDNLTPALFGYRQPFVRKRAGADHWEIANEHIREEPLRIAAQGHTEALAEICCETRLSERAFESTAAVLAWGRDLLAEVGAGLVVVGHPDPSQIDPERAARLARKAPDPQSFDPSLPDQKLARICEGLDVRFETLTPRLGVDDFLLTDVHWTRAGNDKVALLVAELSAELGELIPAPAGADAHEAKAEGAA